MILRICMCSVANDFSGWLTNLMPFQCCVITGSSHDPKTTVSGLLSVWLAQMLCGSLVCLLLQLNLGFPLP